MPRRKNNLLRFLLAEASSRYQVYVKRFILHMDLKRPWMRKREIEVIESVIERLQPQNCLEWGVGHGTAQFTRLLPASAQWLSIEHDQGWAEKIAARITDPRVRVQWQSIPAEEPDNAGAPPDYVDYPGQFGKYDLILVDGRFRSQCLDRAFDWIDDRGIVILHDANRSYYHAPLARFPKQVMLGDWRKTEGGVWIGSKKRDLNDVLDLDRQIELWRTVKRIGMFLRL